MAGRLYIQGLSISLKLRTLKFDRRLFPWTIRHGPAETSLNAGVAVELRGYLVL